MLDRLKFWASFSLHFGAVIVICVILTLAVSMPGLIAAWVGTRFLPPPDPPPPETPYVYRGSGSGHIAGSDWADRNDIQDIEACRNHSASFEEGCIESVIERTGDLLSD